MRGGPIRAFVFSHCGLTQEVLRPRGRAPRVVTRGFVAYAFACKWKGKEKLTIRAFACRRMDRATEAKWLQLRSKAATALA